MKTNETGAYCRDASNRTVDPALCLTHLADSYWSLQLHRECHVPCPHRRCSSSADPLQSAPPCTRNCMGIRKRRERSLSDGNRTFIFKKIKLSQNSYVQTFFKKSNLNGIFL